MTTPDNQGENRIELGYIYIHANIKPGKNNVFFFVLFCFFNATVQSNGEGNEPDIDAPSGGLEPGAIVGIIFGLLIILVLGVAIVVVALFLVSRRKNGGKYSTANNDIGLGKHLYACVIIIIIIRLAVYELDLPSLISSALGNSC